MAQVLVVDDDLGMREWFTEVLEGAGHRVSVARDGLEAKTCVNQEAPEFVITDISMPNEEGLGLLLGMRRSNPALKIIVISGKDPAALDDAMLLGASAAFQKPVAAKTVLQCLGALAEGR
jgi:DNA-binding NtrC family response regulator